MERVNNVPKVLLLERSSSGLKPKSVPRRALTHYALLEFSVSGKGSKAKAHRFNVMWILTQEKVQVSPRAI